MNIKRLLSIGLIAILGLAVISCDKSNTETTTEAEQTTQQVTTSDTTSNSEVTSALSSAEILEAAANKVIISNTDNLTSNFTVPAEVDELTVTWSSNNTDVISVSETVTATTEGYLQYQVTVTRPNQIEGTATVTLTGTFYYGDETFTKDFVLRVPAIDDATIVTTIAAGLALELGTYVTWKDMTVIGKGTEGFFFTDGTDIMYVFNTTFLESVIIGSVYDIKGGVALYYSIPEVKTIDANTVDVQASTGAVRTLTPTPATISQMIANHTGYNDTNPMELTMYRVTGTVYYDSALGADYSTYLIPAGTSTLDQSNAIRIYYKSNMAAVSALDGQQITIDLLLFGYNASSTAWYAYFLGEAADISTANMTDADKLAISEAQLESSYDVTTAFSLPTLTYGDYSNITISTEIASYLSYSGGVFTVTRPATDTSGTLSLTITYNDQVANLVIDINMKAVVVVIPGDDIYISQYIEGGDYNKYIEIYNGTDATVNLSEYTLELYSNGKTTVEASVTLSGTLAPGEVIVVYNNKSATILYVGDIINTNVINFNGNDVIVLKHNDEIVDSIGQIGNDVDYAKDVTLVRKSTVTGGDTDPYDEYDVSSQWDEYAKDSIEDLGTHTQD